MATNRKIASDNDLTSLWNQAYPNASVANASTLAQNQKAVDDMTVRDRLLDSYNFTYGQQRKVSDESYANAISQTDRQALARGMQRSSYNNATLGNLRNKQVEAQNDIYGQQIAAYEQALLNVEQQEQEQANWQKQFDESVRQFNVLHPEALGGGGGGGGGGSSGGGGGRGGKKSTDTTTGGTGSLADKLNSYISQLGSGTPLTGKVSGLASKVANKKKTTSTGGAGGSAFRTNMTK